MCILNIYIYIYFCFNYISHSTLHNWYVKIKIGPSEALYAPVYIILYMTNDKRTLNRHPHQNMGLREGVFYSY